MHRAFRHLPSTMTELRLPWWSRSVDSTYLTGKRVFVFGDATHAIAAARVAATGDGLRGRWPRLPTAREFRPARSRAAAKHLRCRAADYRRLSGSRGGHRSRCAAGADPRHPDGASYRKAPRHSLRRDLMHPFMFRTSRRATPPSWAGKARTSSSTRWVHPLVMGLEEHLLGMFRDDFEFNDGAGHPISARQSPFQSTPRTGHGRQQPRPPTIPVAPPGHRMPKRS